MASSRTRKWFRERGEHYSGGAGGAGRQGLPPLRAEGPLRHGRQQEQPIGTRRQRGETEALIKVAGRLGEGVHDDGIDAQALPRVQDAADGIGQKDVADALPPGAKVPRQPADEGRRDGMVARELLGEVFGEVIELEGECAQAVEAHEAELVVDGHKDLRKVPPSVLAGAVHEPVVEPRLATCKAPAIVLLPQRLDADGQVALAGDLGDVELEGLDQAAGRRPRAANGLEEDLAVGPSEDHALVVLEDMLGSFEGEVGCGETGDDHRSQDDGLR